MMYIFLMVVMCSLYLEISFRNKEQVLYILESFKHLKEEFLSTLVHHIYPVRFELWQISYWGSQRAPSSPPAKKA